MYQTEQEMVKSTIPLLCKRYSINENSIVTEPSGLFGIPDVMIYKKNIISIEFKLRDWKKALKQAYRYKGFSYKSYVILDEQYSKKAVENIELFLNANIGLYTVKDGNLNVHYEPKKEKPYSPNLSKRALAYFLT